MPRSREHRPFGHPAVDGGHGQIEEGFVEQRMIGTRDFDVVGVAISPCRRPGNPPVYRPTLFGADHKNWRGDGVELDCRRVAPVEVGEARFAVRPARFDDGVVQQFAGVLSRLVLPMTWKRVMVGMSGRRHGALWWRKWVPNRRVHVNEEADRRDQLKLAIMIKSQTSKAPRISSAKS